MKRWIKNFNRTVSLPEAVSALQHTAGHLETIYLSFFYFFIPVWETSKACFSKDGEKKKQARLLRALYKSRLMHFKQTITNGADVLLTNINEGREQLESQPGTVQPDVLGALLKTDRQPSFTNSMVDERQPSGRHQSVETSLEFDPAMKKTWLTVSSISLVWAAEMQKRALDSMIGVAGKPTTTVPMFLFIISRPKALKRQRQIRKVRGYPNCPAAHGLTGLNVKYAAV